MTGLETRFAAMEADRSVRIAKAAEDQARLLEHLKMIDRDMIDLTKAVTTVTTKLDDMRSMTPLPPR
jgi:hypothetical protein